MGSFGFGKYQYHRTGKRKGLGGRWEVGVERGPNAGRRMGSTKYCRAPVGVEQEERLGRKMGSVRSSAAAITVQ